MSTASELESIGSGAVVVSAWAPWCSNCRSIAPMVQAVAADSSARLVSLQVDEAPKLVDSLGIGSVPTLIGFDHGHEVGRLSGVQSREAVESLFDATLDATIDVRARPPLSLTALRAAAAAVLTATGAVLGSVPLAVVGVVVAIWSLLPFLRR